MAQDVSANGVQVVGGSNPPCPTNSNPFPQNNLAVSPSPRPSPVSVKVSNRASNLRREQTISRRLARTHFRMRPLHRDRCMDLKNLISRIEIAAALGIEPQTIAKWQRLGLFPEPKECLSDRLILYDRQEVHCDRAA